MDVVIPFVLGMTINLWFVVPLYLFAACVECASNRDDKYAFSSVLTVILTICVFRLLEPSLLIGIGVALLWLPIGAVWAVQKWRMRVAIVKNDFDSGVFTKDDEYVYAAAQKKIDINKSKTVVAHWVLFWHMSMVATLIFDVFEYVEYLITVKFGKVFKDISKGALD